MVKTDLIVEAEGVLYPKLALILRGGAKRRMRDKMQPRVCSCI